MLDSEAGIDSAAVSSLMWARDPLAAAAALPLAYDNRHAVEISAIFILWDVTKFHSV